MSDERSVSGGVVLLAAFDKLKADMEAVERDLRREWWVNHGHPFGPQYGDDGEMQCGKCGVDFKREPLGSLKTRVFELRTQPGPGGLPMTDDFETVREAIWAGGKAAAALDRIEAAREQYRKALEQSAESLHGLGEYPDHTGQFMLRAGHGPEQVLCENYACVRAHAALTQDPED